MGSEASDARPGCGGASEPGVTGRTSGRSEADDGAEVRALQVEVTLIEVDRVVDVEAAVAELRADVVGEIHGAVEVHLEVAGGRAFVEALGQLEAAQLEGEADVARDVDPAD